MSNAPLFLYTNALGTNEFPATRQTITTLSYDNTEAVTCSGIGVCRADRNGRVSAYYSSDGSAYTLAGQLNFAADKTAMTTFDEVSARYWRVVFDASTSVGVVKVGQVLAMQHNNYANVTPPQYAQTDSRRPGALNRGQWLGRQVHGRRTEAEYNATHVTRAWIDANALPLFRSLRDGAGVFYAWRPDTYPQDVIYGFLSSPINPTNQGTLTFVDFTIQLTGIYDTSEPVYTGPTVAPPV